MEPSSAELEVVPIFPTDRQIGFSTDVYQWLGAALAERINDLIRGTVSSGVEGYVGTVFPINCSSINRDQQNMSESTKQAIIRFSIQGFGEHVQDVISIIKEDTGTGEFITQPTSPPIIQPAPLTEQAINKLKALSGVEVVVPEDEED